jgi:predicted AAA+ superfamily ATPase
VRLAISHCHRDCHSRRDAVDVVDGVRIRFAFADRLGLADSVCVPDRDRYADAYPHAGNDANCDCNTNEHSHTDSHSDADSQLC